MKKFLGVLLLSTILLAYCKKNQHDGNYQISTEQSFIKWNGHLQQGGNQGTFNVESSGIKAENGKIRAGSFTIPISSLNVTNLQGELKEMLTTHLKTADFFNIMVYPTAAFSITRTEPYTGDGGVAGANVLVTGNFILIGKTKSISFPAKIDLKDKKLAVKAAFKINRLDYGMTYASDPAAGEHYILPDVDIELDIHGTKL